MRYTFFAVFLIVCSFNELESTLGPGNRKSSSRASTKVYKSSSSPEILENEQQNESESAPSSSFVDPSPSHEMNVLERDLIQEEITPSSIVAYHDSYCSACAATRQFQNPTLIFITPWNNRGYDLVKIFTKKFDYIVPVWFSVKRTGFEQYAIEGLHDIDAKWIETLKENHADVKILPRVVFEKWPVANVHALFQSEDEKQQLATTLVQLLINHAHLFDGFVLDPLIQFHDTEKNNVHHILRDIAERIHQIETNGSRKKEVFLIVPPTIKVFDRNDFQALRDDLDGFIIMTFEFPSREPAPVSPIEWVKEVMEQFPVSKTDTTVKVFLGVNFYGYRHDRMALPTENGQYPYNSRSLLGKDYIEFLRQYKSRVKIIFDRRAQEHITIFHGQPTKKVNQDNKVTPEIVIFYPSLKSIYERLSLAMRKHVGIAIWEGGQGLDYFYDLI